MVKQRKAMHPPKTKSFKGEFFCYYFVGARVCTNIAFPLSEREYNRENVGERSKRERVFPLKV